MRELGLRLAKSAIAVEVDTHTVFLADDAAHARRIVDALAATGAIAIRGDDGARGRVADLLPRQAGADAVQRILHELQLDEALLDWRLRDTGPLQRMVAATVLALASGADLLAFDVAGTVRSPFDAATVCAHMRRVVSAFGVTVIAVIDDPALITSAGTHLVAFQGDAVAESGAVGITLARPRSDALLARLEATPIASPVAMQMRRVQRLATQPVNYAHTTIIALPTADSVALAGGEEDASTVAPVLP